MQPCCPAPPYCDLLRYGEYGTTDNHGVAHIVADVLYQALCLVGQGRLMCLGLGHNLVRWRICSKPPPSCGTTHYLIRSMWSILGGNQGTNFACQNIGQFVDHFWSILVNFLGCCYMSEILATCSYNEDWIDTLAQTEGCRELHQWLQILSENCRTLIVALIAPFFKPPI